MEYQIDYSWDAEASVWIATSKDVAGLVLESESLESLAKRARDVATELLQLNNPAEKTPAIFFTDNILICSKDPKSPL